MLGNLIRRKGLLLQKEADFRVREQELLDRLAQGLDRFGQDIRPDDRLRFEEARLQLEDLFLIVIAGEFNSGKSSFINALLGERVLPEGVTPTTDRINILKYGPEVSEEMSEAYLVTRTFPSPLLEDLSIVDTPGTNAVIRQHEELTRNFIPRCDLVLFVTSADRPFTESERIFLQHISEWGKKVVFVLNKIDILNNENEIREVTRYIQTHAGEVLGSDVVVLPVSAKQAAVSGADHDSKLWKTSGFGKLEEYLVETLTKEERVRLKLLNPLNVGLRLASVYKEEAFNRLKLLSADITAIENIDKQLSGYHEEILRDFQPRLQAAESLLQEMEIRGLSFFDDAIRLGKIRSLFNPSKVKREFEKIAIAETPARLEEDVVGLIDWIAERNLKLWQDIDRYIDKKQISRHKEDLIGEIGGSFHYNRQALYESIGRVSREVITSYNKEHEAEKLASEVRDSFATTALAEVGAVGLGALLVTIAHTAFADFTGILAAAALALGGLYILPAKRNRVKKEFRKRIADLKTSLNRTLTHQINKEVASAQERINQTISPYRRFVMTHQEQLSEAQAELVTVERGLQRLKAEIEATGNKQ